MPNQSIDRLVAFRSTWEDDALVDEESGLTTEDLDAVIEMARRGDGVVEIQQVEMGKPAPPIRSH